MNLQNDNSGFIRKLFTRQVWLGVTAQVVASFAPIVCGMIAGIVFGITGLAVAGLFAPLFFLAGFFGTIIAGGSTALATKYIAQGDNNRVTEIYSLALLMAVLCSLALFALCMLMREQLLLLIAGTGDLQEAAARYYTPSVWYTCFSVMALIPLFWARLIGRPKLALILTMILTGGSITFSLLFTFIFAMGLEGLATAQALGTALAFLIVLAMQHLPKNGLRLTRPRHLKEDAIALVAAGSPLGLSRLYRFFSLFIINIILLNTVGPEAVAVLAVLNILLRFVTAFVGGVSAAQMPIAGVLWEERDNTSLRQLARMTFIHGNVIVFAVAVLIFIFNRNVALMFGADGEMFFFALLCFCIFISFYMNGNLFISWYTALRRVKLANAVTLLLDMAFPVMFAFLFSGLGGSMVWLYLPTIGLAMVLSVPALLLLMYRYEKGISFPFLLDTKPAITALAFSVERTAEKASEASLAIGDFCKGAGFEKKKSMLLSMAIEEMITLMAEQNPGGGDISVRLSPSDDGVILRLRDTGRKFNPIEYYSKRLEMMEDIENNIDLMGVKYITEVAKSLSYRTTFGVNNLIVTI